MRKPNKKGFTIVELVIVIAVVAILAAVLIPTFVSVTNKAKQSADIQACRQMNTYLAVNEVTDGKTIQEVYTTLKEGGMSAENYKPLSSNTYYFWDETLNRILYTNENYEVTFPEEYKNVTKNDHQWFTLSGKIASEEIPKVNNTYNVTKPEQLMYISEQKLSDETTITLPEKMDLMGACLKFDVAEGANITIKPESTAADAKVTIKGFANSESKFTGVANYDPSKPYAAALIPNVKNATVKVENLVIDGASVGSYDIGSTSFIIGVAEYSNVTIENVQINDSIVYGMNKVGSFIGQVHSSTVNITKCSVTNTKIYCTEGEAGIYFGGVYNYSSNDEKEKNTITVNDVTTNNNEVKLVETGDRDYVYNVTFGENVPKQAKADALCRATNGGSLTDQYRTFYKNALFTYYGSFTYNGSESNSGAYLFGSAKRNEKGEASEWYKATADGKEYTIKSSTLFVYEAE